MLPHTLVIGARLGKQQRYCSLFQKAEAKGIGQSEAKKPTSKAAKKKIEGAALIGIDVAKEEDFPGWYQQVLIKGDMLDYYDVSGCFILKVPYILLPPTLVIHKYLLTFPSQLHTLSGRQFNNGLTTRSKEWVSGTVPFLCLFRRMF
jgi:hypothetical protein